MFDGEAAWRKEEPGSGGDDQEAIRASERGAESLDGMPICLAVSHEFREIVVEGGMNHGIGHRCTTAQAFQISKITSMDLGASGGKRLRGRI